MAMSADIVEVYWNARPSLERAGVNLRRGSIDDKGQRLLDEVRRSLVDAFPSAPVLVRFAVHTKAPTDDLRVVRQGVERSDRLEEIRAVIERAIQRVQYEPA
jgi:hypothetical protein